MNIELAVELLRTTFTQALTLVLPLLLAILFVGVIISLLQSVTSIQEQTLTFVPKLVVASIVFLATAYWSIQSMMTFTTLMFQRLPDMVR